MHLPLYYEVVYHLSASEAGLALIPLAAVSTCGAAIAGRTMARAKHYKRVAIVAPRRRAVFGVVLAVTTLPLWGLLIAAVAVLARPRHGVSGQRGLAPEFGGARADRHRDRRDEFLPRADVVVHGGGVHRHPADGAGLGHFARRRASRRRRVRSPPPTWSRRSAMCSAPPRRCSPRRALHDPDGRTAAGRSRSTPVEMAE